MFAKVLTVIASFALIAALYFSAVEASLSISGGSLLVAGLAYIAAGRSRYGRRD